MFFAAQGTHRLLGGQQGSPPNVLRRTGAVSHSSAARTANGCPVTGRDTSSTAPNGERSVVGPEQEKGERVLALNGGKFTSVPLRVIARATTNRDAGVVGRPEDNDLNNFSITKGRALLLIVGVADGNVVSCEDFDGSREGKKRSRKKITMVG